MDVFESKHNVFDKEKYKGKNASHIQEVKAELRECVSQKQQDYKFRQLQKKFRPDSIFNKFINESKVCEDQDI